ncbi:hypothetical protein [Gluconacetobacter sp.]|uniref:hypothetical protein n=1 Tax=Gluconacetobacter sp. TaxID=1935994 RepID=UPI0039EC7C18
MTDNQTTRKRVTEWLCETKTYPNGATFSRKQALLWTTLTLAVVPLVAVSFTILLKYG